MNDQLSLPQMMLLSLIQAMVHLMAKYLAFHVGKDDGTTEVDRTSTADGTPDEFLQNILVGADHERRI